MKLTPSPETVLLKNKNKQTLLLSQANYETGAGTYKHVYFNATLQTWLMWCLTLAAVLALYESVKYLIRLLVKRQARFETYPFLWFFLFVCSF